MPDPSVDFLESFDYYPAAQATPGIGVFSTWIGNTNTNVVSLTEGRFGAQALHCVSNSGTGFEFVKRVIPSSSVKVLGFALRDARLSQETTGIGLAVIALRNTAEERVLTMTVNYYGEVRLFAGDVDGTLLGVSTSKQVLNNTWHYVEIAFKAADAGGYAKLYIDGALQFEFNGDTLGAVSDAQMTRFEIALVSSEAGGTTRDYDDMYCMSNQVEVFGESRLQPLEMTADSAVQFTRISGDANYEMIDASSMLDDSTYNYSNTVGQRDIFEHDAITVTPESIHFVSTVMAAKKVDSGTLTVKSVIVDGSGELEGAETNLTSDYIWIRDYFSLNSDDEELTKTRINAMLPGYELVL